MSPSWSLDQTDRHESNDRSKPEILCSVFGATRVIFMKRTHTDIEVQDEDKGGGEVQGHLLMQRSSSRRRAMRVCQPRGRMRMYRATMGGRRRFWTEEVRSAFP